MNPEFALQRERIETQIRTEFLVKLRSYSILAIALTVYSVPAQSLTNLAGVLNGIYFQVPTQLTATTSSNGVVVDVPQSQSFGSGIFQVTVQNNGTFSGGDSGTLSIDGQGMVTVRPSGQPPISMRINSSQDAWIGLANENNNGLPQNSLNIGARAPQSASGSDIAGNWAMVMMDTPEQLVQVTSTNGALVDLLGESGSSISGNPIGQLGTGSMTINSNGTLSGTAQDAFTGSYIIGTNGQLEVAINSRDNFTMPAFLNRSKDVMFALHRDDTNNAQQIILMVKTPASASVSDLRGLWQVTTFSVPGQIILNRNINNEITSIAVSGGFNQSQSSYYAAGSDGFVSGSIENVPTIGALGIGVGGSATVTFTNTLGQTQSHTGYLNASKNCIIVAETDGDTVGITVVTRAPDWPGSQNVGLQTFPGYGIVWAGDTNTVLQSSSGLNGGWNDISPTLGRHQYSASPASTAQFYRVKVQ